MRSRSFSLYEVSVKIQEVVNSSFEDSFWVSAEISEIKENRTGHCYLELVEKELDGNQPKAKLRATIWAGIYRSIKPFFETSTGIKLTSGIKVLVLCQVNYHPVYGFSLNIQDIDPSFTLGDIEQKRRETINRLIADGVFDMNRELKLPKLPKRVAIISSPTAAGYQDFVNQLDLNPYGYKFMYKVFSAVVQGDKAEESIIDALNRINLEVENWDLAALIRGGGSQTDLLCFDSYQLANHVAQFPLPVITGIGHEKDTSITDLVAHTRLKTPTAAAEFLVSLMIDAEKELNSLIGDFTDLIGGIVNEQRLEISRIHNRLVPNVLRVVNAQKIRIKSLSLNSKEHISKLIALQDQEFGFIEKFLISKLNEIIYLEEKHLNTLLVEVKKGTQFMLKLSGEKMHLYERTNDTLNPESAFKRGFSITMYSGKPLKSINEIGSEKELETYLHDGKVKSALKKVINK